MTDRFLVRGKSFRLVSLILMTILFSLTMPPVKADGYKRYYNEIPSVMGAVLDIPMEWKTQSLQSDPPTAYDMLSIQNPEGTSQIDLYFFPLLSYMTPYESVQEFAQTVKQQFMKTPNRWLISEGPRSVGDYKGYELVIGSPPGRLIFFLLKEERGCWAFLLAMYDPKKESTERPILEKMISTFRPAFRVTLDVDWPVNLKIDEKEEKPPTALYLSPFKYYSLEAPQTSLKEQRTRFVFESWSVNTRVESDARIRIYTSESIAVKAFYRLEFKLDVLSEYGTVEGAGWYKESSDAKVTLTPVTIDGLVMQKFSHWEGDFPGTDPAIAVKMDAPKTIKAVWRTDYSNLYMMGALLAALSVGLALVLSKRRLVASHPKTPKTAEVYLQQTTQPALEQVRDQPTERKCLGCGNVLEKEEDFCPNCGKKWG